MLNMDRKFWKAHLESLRAIDHTLSDLLSAIANQVEPLSSREERKVEMIEEVWRVVADAIVICEKLATNQIPQKGKW